MNIQLQGSIALKPIFKNSLPVHELSGIAWDEDEQLLYAISDEGLLYHLSVNSEKNKLNSVKVISAMRLMSYKGSALRGKYSDSEGLSILNANNGKKGDSELIISFENKPRIAKYSTQGKFLSSIKMPKKLTKKKYFRHKNKALESVTVHPKYGILTAAEYPLKSHKKSQQTLYSSSGKEWHFPTEKDKNSAITSLDILKNGDVLVLERAYVNLFTPIVITLSRVSLNKCDKSRSCKKETIARLTGADGWLLDNFEGLAHYRDNQYFLVSDNNKNPLQKTLMILFEVKP
ncbi:MAG: esterase-like activity of phytase family protein [Cocleimonas sp.]|nr:esterase-like activity of phytase family protein [Cocleimonas sp.]